MKAIAWDLLFSKEARMTELFLSLETTYHNTGTRTDGTDNGLG